MYLKEFDLDIMYEYENEEITHIVEKENVSFDEARLLNYQNSFKEKRRNFKLQTRCISSMYSRIFSKKSINYNFWKIIVVCCKSAENIINPVIIGGVVEVYIHFNYDYFFQATDLTKKELALKILMDGIDCLIHEFNLPQFPFISTKEAVVKSNYTNHWVWKEKWNNSRKYKAYICCEHEVFQLAIYLAVYDKQKQTIEKELVVTTLPDEWNYFSFLGDLKWTSKNEVALISKENSIVFSKKII